MILREKIYYSKKETIAQKSLDNNKFLNTLLKEIKKDKDLFEKLNRLAELNDSFSNFMPHPGFPFNQLKGTTSDVHDNLSIMIGKIQNHISKNEAWNYNSKSADLNGWHKWFIKHREDYCLDGFYDISDNKELKVNDELVKLPTNKDVLVKYISEIVEKLENRATLIVERMK